MTYTFNEGLFSISYMYFDLFKDGIYLADSIFYKRQIPIKFKDELERDGDKYRVIFCKIKKRYKKQMEEALNEIPHKMELLGHNDYVEYCESVLKEIEEEADELSN